MKIHLLWICCIIIRLLLIYLIQTNKKIMGIIILTMGLGFVYKSITGSNNEIQIQKVFWHSTRLLHGILYIFAAINIYNNSKYSGLILLLDILFSICFRLITNQ